MRFPIPMLAAIALACGGRSYKDDRPVLPDPDSDVDTDADADTDEAGDTDEDGPGETDEPAGCTEDADEPNDNFDAAIPRDGGVDLALTEDSPADYWTFSATAGTEYTVTVTHDVAAGNIDLQIYNPSEGSVTNGLSNTSNPVETVTFTANQTGTFFARVTLRTGEGSTCNTYDLEVTP